MDSDTQDTQGGRDPAGQALAVPAEPASGLVASRFDPSRDPSVGFYRKKPVVIEAYRFDNRISNLPPFWLTRKQDDSTIRVETNPLAMFIKTLEGEMRADEGDWIIKGVAGEIYPCKPDIFEATYDPA